MKNVLLRHKKTLIIGAAVLLAAAACAAIWTLQPAKLEGKYKSLLNENVCLTLKENGSFLITRTVENDSGAAEEQQENSGAWKQQEDGTVQLISETTGETVLFHKNQYLIDTTYAFLGEIPSGSRFDAKCTYYYPDYEEEDHYINVVFKADGVFLYSTHWGDAGERRYGTYTRKGDLLEAVYDDNGETHRFIVYKDGISDNLYELQPSE